MGFALNREVHILPKWILQGLLANVQLRHGCTLQFSRKLEIWIWGGGDIQILKSKLKHLQILALFDILDLCLLNVDLMITQGAPTLWLFLKKKFVLNATVTILGHSLYCKYAFMTEGCILFQIKLGGLLKFYLEQLYLKRSHSIPILLNKKKKNLTPLKIFP